MSDASKDLTKGVYKDILSNERRILGQDFFGDFLNWGYWKADTETQIEACANLAALVFGMIPNLEGRVLEVGCGIGGVTRELSKLLPAEQLTAINILDEQLERCRELVPGATFLNMDATSMDFPDEDFDHIVSVEAAHHFSSRERFFREALRALKPGGYLALCDIIGYPLGGRASHVADPRAYAELLTGLGYCELRVVDITADSAHAHADHVLGWLAERQRRGEIDQATAEMAAIGRLVRLTLTPYYVLIGARKPLPGKPSWRRAPGDHLNAYLKELVVKTAGI